MRQLRRSGGQQPGTVLCIRWQRKRFGTSPECHRGAGRIDRNELNAVTGVQVVARPQAGPAVGVHAEVEGIVATGGLKTGIDRWHMRNRVALGILEFLLLGWPDHDE